MARQFREEDRFKFNLCNSTTDRDPCPCDFSSSKIMGPDHRLYLHPEVWTLKSTSRTYVNPSSRSEITLKVSLLLTLFRSSKLLALCE